ncbi:hypothetical protein [uncultured Polaribacter sp.]|uniref:hypothetical protein n=1 Tax=uncultured Polaribacter sp. TaxID=174711 RepID=UPI002606ED9B|nr:hypothetical protein [uncultured Polaribacter sp.]
MESYKSCVSKSYDEKYDQEFQIYFGDIDNDEFLKFDALNIIIIGNIKTKWLNAVNNYTLGYDEGGSIFITGNVDCSYFSNHYGKLIVIGDSLKVNKILDNAFEDSALIIKNNLTTEYFNGLDIWAEAGGFIKIEYGDGYCLPLGYTNAKEQAVKPKNSESESHQFLGIEDKITEYGDRESLVREIIEQNNN